MIPVASVQLHEPPNSKTEFPDLGKADLAAYGDLVAAWGVGDDGRGDELNVKSTSQQAEVGAP